MWKDVHRHIDWWFYFVLDFFDFNLDYIARLDGTVDLEGRGDIGRAHELNSDAVAVARRGPATKQDCFRGGDRSRDGVGVGNVATTSCGLRKFHVVS